MTRPESVDFRQYKKHGQYDSQMIDKKFIKRKFKISVKTLCLMLKDVSYVHVVLVLLEEVTKTNEMGILKPW